MSDTGKSVGQDQGEVTMIRASEFFAAGIKDFLEVDRRPMVVFDCHDDEQVPNLVHSIFANASFRRLRDRILFTDRLAPRLKTANLGFHRWAVSSIDKDTGKSQADTHFYAGLRWQRFKSCGRWIIVTPIEPLHEDAVADKSAVASEQAIELRIASKDSTVRNFDWTVSPPPAGISDYIKLFRSIDWSSTDAGSMDTWPFQLRSMLNLIMADPNPAVVFWQKDLIMFYNEAYTSIAGGKHPKLLGSAPADAWAEVFDRFVPLFEKGFKQGLASKEKDVLLFLERNGYPEELYMSYAFVPMVGEDGQVNGFHQQIVDTTDEVLSKRRMDILLALSQLKAESLASFFQGLLALMEPFTIDIPFAILYSVHAHGASPADTTQIESDSAICQLEGAVGIPRADLEASFDLYDGNHPFANMFRKAQAARGQTTISRQDEHWPCLLLGHKNPERAFGDFCDQATVYHLRPSVGAVAHSFLIVGLNPRQVNASGQQEFRHVLGRQLTAAMASVTLFEHQARESNRRAQEAARDMDIIENRFYRVAQLSPVGVFVLEKDGSIIYCNDKWYEYSGVIRGDDKSSWMTMVWPDDQHLVKAQWTRLVEERVPVSFEFRYKNVAKTSLQDQHEKQDDSTVVWLLASAYPDISDDGSFLSVSGNLTEISQQKRAEVESERRATEALESKRQQENFMDITSHEMRNPLTAILMCADLVLRILKNMSKTADQTEQTEQIEESVDAVETIIHCAEHQKSIADELLTMSKLDADLLNVTPVPAQPVELARHALSMFQVQAQKAHVALDLELDQSLSCLDVHWVQLDPSRVVQIIINLVSNAMKFTGSKGNRSVKLRIAASLSEPEDGVSGIRYVPSKNIQAAASKTCLKEDMKDRMFLSFHLQDTGCGLTEEEQEKLFDSFVQASPRTHVQYGGSGLGLFISRALTELQGGRIGIASQLQKGSVIAFYIRVNRCDSPKAIASVSQREPEETQLGPSLEIGPTFDSWLKGASVLIVEDNLVNLKVLRRQVSPLVRETHVAGNGVEALEFIQSTMRWKANRESKMDLTLVLLDIEMPVMGGLACIREIRRLEQEGQIRGHLFVVAVTANARQEQIMTAKQAGMSDVLTKPFRIRDLKLLFKQAYADGKVK